MSELDPVAFGEMKAKLAALEAEVREVRLDVKELLELANRSRGGFWIGMAMASTAGAVAAWAADKMVFK